MRPELLSSASKIEGNLKLSKMGVERGMAVLKINYYITLFLVSLSKNLCRD